MHVIYTHVILLLIYVDKRGPIGFSASTFQRHVVTIGIIDANGGTKEPNLNVAATGDPVTDKHELDIGRQ